MATIDDVARAAGVSVSTVSYALSGKRPISAATRARVERAVRELDYHAHAGARALASSRSDVIALVVPFRPGINVQIIMQFVGGVVTAAREHDHDVLLLTQDDPTGMARVAGSSTADAIVVMDIGSDDPRLPALRALTVPCVLIGVPDDTTGLACVDLDFGAAGRLAVRELARRGHRRIALVGASQEEIAQHANYALRMRDGVRAQAGAEGVDALLVPAAPGFAGGVDAVDKVLAQQPGTTGLVVHNEAALGGVLAGLERRGLRVPEDVSLVAVSPVDIAAALPVPVSTIEVPGMRIGRTAVEMVMARLGGDAVPETRLVTPALLGDESLAAPPVTVTRAAADDRVGA
ncbi:LacI family DNA-binding transcriptional regulator [Cellulomonas marina]|uniref:DNA-binding transcriptional regulator, LacI/PurR family n=1 Tax=Cellulomonas marina TaxID=988821 RepID=A0A1I1AXZ3_9CELL|nr:LacI family DNA-binding transcriptional regulator [Cellulomonas marina]GIG30235.1 LacI family transcriptional regulator [Cellulomonas marina]SFB41240.1 DNA-binding transcriptional regulator, LacI/PurR family [Cellulomonas marina]